MLLAFRILFNAEPFNVFKVSLMEVGRGQGKTYFLRAFDTDGAEFDSIHFARPAEANRAMQELLKWARAN